MPEFFEALLVLATIAVFSVITLKKRSLDEEGILIADIVGLLVYLIGGISSFATMVVFFVAAEFTTRVARKKRGFEHEKRTTGNIFGKSGAAVIALFLQSNIGFFGAMSAALSDTLSSEIGLLSKKKPFLITNPKTLVPPGTDGGITMLGLTAAVFGGIVIGIVYYYFFGNTIGSIAVALSGFVGSLVDSLFGAVFERRKMLENTEVNFFGSAAGALTAYYLFSLLS